VLIASLLAAHAPWIGAAYGEVIGEASSGQLSQADERRTATIHWQRVPLRDALDHLQDHFGNVVFLDRRVDPSQRVSLDTEANSAADVLTALAAGIGLGTSRLGGVLYLGPRPVAEQLRTLAALRTDELYHLPGSVRDALDRRRALDWTRMAEPRTLIATMIASRGWRIDGSERIPHDLWPAGRLPASALTEQLTILLAGFDLTFQMRAKERAIEIVPVSGPLTLHRRYRLPEHLERPAAALRQQVPAAKTRIEDGIAVIDARAEDHEQVAKWLRGRTASKNAPKKKTKTRQVYTLRVEEKPVGAVIRELAQRLNWQVEFDEPAIHAAGLSLETNVSFAVENAEQDQLLESLLHPAGLDFRRDDDRLRVIPRAGASSDP
jgi:hypothetical protein